VNPDPTVGRLRSPVAPDQAEGAGSLRSKAERLDRGDLVAVRLEWDGKPQQVERLVLPFQTVETINESRATRERDAGSLLQTEPGLSTARNQLIWATTSW